VINPAILVEVTSRSTEDYDRGEKARHYKLLPSLRAILIVSHREREITVFSRAGDGFDERVVRTGERLRLASPALDVAVDDIYQGVVLDPE
jgi:Uma2 family endonuclease